MIIKRVTDLVYRGSRPLNTAELLGMDIRAILSLETGVYEFFHDDSYAAEKSKLSIPEGAAILELQFSDIFPPSIIQLRQALRFIEEGRIRHVITFVHCLSGVDRTGAVIAAYRAVRCGWPIEHAIREMIDEEQHWWFRWWNPILRRRIEKLKEQL